MKLQPDARIEAFDYVVALIFQRLYEQFPERGLLKGMPLVLDAALDQDLAESVKYEVPKIFSDTMIWLKDEGFVRYDRQLAGDFENATLTLRALTVLGYVPVSLEASPQTEPLMQKISVALKSAAGTTATEIIKQSVSKIFTLMLTGSASSGGIGV